MAAAQGLISSGRTRLRHVSPVIGVELLRFCAGLTVWSFSMLIISGLDVTIVGYYRFSAAGLSALMAPVAALHARGEVGRIQQVVFIATRLTLFANFLHACQSTQRARFPF